MLSFLSIDITWINCPLCLTISSETKRIRNYQWNHIVAAKVWFALHLSALHRHTHKITIASTYTATLSKKITIRCSPNIISTLQCIHPNTTLRNSIGAQKHMILGTTHVWCPSAAPEKDFYKQYIATIHRLTYTLADAFCFVWPNDWYR
jgi:hypothetical protein